MSIDDRQLDEGLTPENGCQTDSSAKLADGIAAKSVVEVPSAPVKRGPGAPRHNRNGIGPGTYCFVRGRFPKGAEWIARQLRLPDQAFRKAVVDRDGATTPYTEALINSAVTHEGRRLLLTRWLRLEGEELPVLDRAALLEKIGKAADARDNCLRLLKLDQSKSVNPWDAAFAKPAQALPVPEDGPEVVE